MNDIERLNAQYENLTSFAKNLENVQRMLSNESYSALQKISGALKALQTSPFLETMRSYPILIEIVVLASQYLHCKDAVQIFKNKLLNLQESSIASAIAEMANAQKIFDQSKINYMKAHSCAIHSPETLSDRLLWCTKNVFSSVSETIDNILDEARNQIDRKNPIEMGLEDLFSPTKELPSEIMVARYQKKENVLPILYAIGEAHTYQEIRSDLRKQGNILIESTEEPVSSEAIDAFILAYVLKIIEIFPLGNANIHIFVRNKNRLYQRLEDIFCRNAAGETARHVVQFHSDLLFLKQLQDVTCKEIFSKTSYEHPDIYDVYNKDKSDAFNFIILRDSVFGESGLSSFLEMLTALTKPGDTEHRCGLRFLMIEDKSGIHEKEKKILDSIEHNFGITMHYAAGKFVSETHELDTLHVSGDLEEYVQERSKILAEAISKKEQNLVAIDDIASARNCEPLGGILRIPVGTSGDSIIELPFSCKDEGGTIEGQCIGYMAIGQSGSGKSSFFHSLVINGCLKYSPNDLQFWLLDFKNGGASSKYHHSGLPHIKMIAEDNRIDDALCLFQMVLEEMERRSKAFNAYNTDNIVDYNRKAEKQGLEYFPRVIIAIDEVQEIFREESASVLQKLISSIASRMRAAGMHFVMVAQNLSDGKSYMLKDAFLPSASGRICFRVASASIPHDSGFGEEFDQRKKEVMELNTGEAYVSYGKGTIMKVKMGYTSSEEMGTHYFPEIKERFQEFDNRKPLIIGSKQRLSVVSSLQGNTRSYGDEILRSSESQKRICSAVIGEDAYRMSPLRMQFSQTGNSSMLFLGSDTQIASSLCASVVLSLREQNAEVHMFNGDRSQIRNGETSVPHVFSYICRTIDANHPFIKNHRLNEFGAVLKTVYTEFLKRRSMMQQSDDDIMFNPVFLVINDLLALESFERNELIENGSETEEKDSFSGFFKNMTSGRDFFAESGETGSNNPESFRENVQNIIVSILQNGWRYGIYAILSIKDNSHSWRNSRVVSEVPNTIMFNKNSFVSDFDNAYYLKEMLKNISNDGESETMAVQKRMNGTYSKVRPIIYDLSNPQEKSTIDQILRGE